MMADTSAPVAGCVHDCTQAKGVGSASFTAKCTAAGWAALGSISIGCRNDVSGCECPATNPGFSLAYKKAVTPASPAPTPVPTQSSPASTVRPSWLASAAATAAVLLLAIAQTK